MCYFIPCYNYIRMVTHRVLASSFLFLLCICGSAVSSPKSTTETEIRVGIVPEQNIFRQSHNYRALAEYLSKKAGIKVSVSALSDYGSIIGSMKDGHINGGFLGALAGAVAHERLDAEAIAIPVTTEGKTTYRAYLFVRKNSGISNIQDMRGKTIALVSRGSFSGYVYPLAYFRQHGISDISKFFRESYFAGSYDAAIHAVLNGAADIGSAGSKVYNSLKLSDPRIEKELTILDESMDVPYYGLFLAKSISQTTKNAVRRVLVAMQHDAEGAAILKQLDLRGFAPATSHVNYNSVFMTAKKAGIDLKTYRLEK